MATLRPAERDCLLIVLALSAGSADAWSYFGLNHSFVANMTGNTVLIGIAVARHNGDFLHPLISLAFYALGVIAGTLVTGRQRSDEGSWSRAVSWTLLLESVLFAATECGWAMLRNTGPHTEPQRNMLLAMAAIAVGMQSGAMLHMNIPGIVTTYVTGTWTNLISGATRFVAHGERPLKGGKKRRFEERLLLQATVLCAYLLGAMAAGWLLRFLPAFTGVLPSSAIIVASVYGFIRT